MDTGVSSLFYFLEVKLEESDSIVDVCGDEEREERKYASNENSGRNLQSQQLREPMNFRIRITIFIS
jgi:hypothetical protein